MTAAVRLSESMSDAEKTAIRRELNATPPAPTVELAEPAKGETVADVIRAFECGLDNLHGTPRHLVDFPKLYAALEREARRTGER